MVIIHGLYMGVGMILQKGPICQNSIVAREVWLGIPAPLKGTGTILVVTVGEGQAHGICGESSTLQSYHGQGRRREQGGAVSHQSLCEGGDLKQKISKKNDWIEMSPALLATAAREGFLEVGLCTSIPSLW